MSHIHKQIKQKRLRNKKICLTYLTIKEMQIKTILSFNLTLVTMDKINKANDSTNWRRY